MGSLRFYFRSGLLFCVFTLVLILSFMLTLFYFCSVQPKKKYFTSASSCKCRTDGLRCIPPGCMYGCMYVFLIFAVDLLRHACVIFFLQCHYPWLQDRVQDALLAKK